MKHWFAMHNYANYIWPGYLSVIAVLLWNGIYVQWQKRRTFQKIQQWIKYASSSKT